MLDVFEERIKIMLPRHIFSTAKNNQELERKVIEYLARSFPDRRLVHIKEPFAICEKN